MRRKDREGLDSQEITSDDEDLSDDDYADIVNDFNYVMRKKMERRQKHLKMHQKELDEIRELENSSYDSEEEIARQMLPQANKNFLMRVSSTDKQAFLN